MLVFRVDIRAWRAARMGPGMAWTRITSFGWLVLVVALLYAAGRRDLAPGDPGAPPTDWPAGTALRLGRDAPTLVMLAHPQCPCTVAALEGLEGLLQDGRRRGRVYVVLTIPPGAPRGFEEGAVLDRARRLVDVTVVVDRGGSETARFGARTSGHVLAFDPAGRRRFAGGVTPGRGHRGDAPGLRALEAVLLGEAAEPDAPVFGCPLAEEEGEG